MLQFKRFIGTFLLLHLFFGILVFAGYRFFTDLTGETGAYLFWFLIIFSLLATLVQALVFTTLTRVQRIHRAVFFVLAFVLEILIANLLVVNWAGSEQGFTSDLLADIRFHNYGKDMAGSLIMHVAVLLATAIITLMRPVYKPV